MIPVLRSGLLLGDREGAVGRVLVPGEDAAVTVVWVVALEGAPVA
jgi:hypothetical protein